MKTSENLKELYPHVNSMLADIDTTIKDYSKKIKKELSQKLIDEKIKLLKAICDGENLSFSDLKSKYLNDKEKKSVKDSYEYNDTNVEELLDAISINGKIYFYENKDKGKIFNEKSEVVGEFKNGLPVLNK